MINTGDGRYILFVGDIVGDKFFAMGDISTETDRVNNRVNVHLAENKACSKGLLENQLVGAYELLARRFF